MEWRTMIKYFNECVNCGQPCIYDSCKYYSSPHLICDQCGDEADSLYTYDNNTQLCRDCLIGKFDEVKL